MKRNFKKWMLVGLCTMMSMQTSVAVLAEEMSLSEVQSNETVIVQGETAQWKKDETGWKYQRADGSYVVNQWDQINGNWYHFDQNGYMETGWKKLNGSWYYLKSSGAMATYWEKVGSDWYYFDPSGAMQVGWAKSGTIWYYLKPDGRMTANQWEQVSGNWYHFDTNGVMQTGWLKIGNIWYYLKPSGNMTANQWEQVSGNWYHFDANGMMQTGWLQLGNTWYYLKSNGAMAVNEWVERDRYYVDSNGVYIPGKKKTYTDNIYTIDLGNGQTTTVKGHIDVQMESQIFDMVNQYRKEQGLEEQAILSPGSAAMQAAVDTRAVEISYSFSHTRPNGLTPFSFSDAPEICAENIAAGYPNAQSVMTGWKNSPGHNANMLEYIIDSGSIGVFAKYVGTNSYTYYYVQLFGSEWFYREKSDNISEAVIIWQLLFLRAF